MANKEALIIYARSVAASFNQMKMEDQVSFLVDMYDKTLKEKPVNWTLKGPQGTNVEALHNKRWLRKDGQPGGTTISAMGVMWCGIFATYCLRAIGVPAEWKSGIGIWAPPGLLEKRNGYFQHSDIQRGDICVVQDNQHHFIVHNRVGQQLYSYDGNLDGQKIGERNYNIDTLRQGVKDQAIYDNSPMGKIAPDNTKYSFAYYRLL